MVSTILPFLIIVVASNEEILPWSMKVLVEHRLSMPRNKKSYPVFLSSKESLAKFSYLGNPVGFDKLFPNSAKQRKRVKAVFFIITNVRGKNLVRLQMALRLILQFFQRCF